MAVTLEPSHWGLLILTGALLGLFLGLFGKAGGLAIAPALLIVLPACGVPVAAVPRLATASAIAILIPLTIAQAGGPLRRKAIDWDVFLLLAPSAAVGAVLVTTFTDAFDGRLLALLLAGTTTLLAIRLCKTRALRAGPFTPPHAPPLIAMTLKTVASGAGAALAGLNAALIVAPTLKRALAPDNAEATASAVTLPFALAASAGYLLSPPPSGCGPACAGALFLPALAATGMTALLTAPLAARLSPFLPRPAATRLFAALVIASACLFGVPPKAVWTFLNETGETAIELVLGPICDPGPAPANPVLGSREEQPDRLAQSPLTAEAR
jgi:uncharacterized membrane protein YfcA